VATRIIDSPRERLIAIITNNFSLCNGRWPTQILMATVFVGALAPPSLAGIVAASSVFFVAVLGFVFALGSSWLLSRTLLKGQASSFSLELPPYRPPDILRTLYTSLIDRTLFVLWRAVVFAVPAGAVICVEPKLRVKEETSRRPPAIRTPLSPLRVICPAGTWIVVSTNKLPLAWSASWPPPCNSVSVFEPAVAGDRRAISPWPLMAAKPPAVVTIRPAAISRSAPTRNCAPPARLSR